MEVSFVEALNIIIKYQNGTRKVSLVVRCPLFIGVLEFHCNTINCFFVGEEIGFYFAWMTYYSRCILIPLFIGLVMFILRPSDCTVDTDAYLPFYSIIVAIWAVLFLVVR